MDVIEGRGPSPVCVYRLVQRLPDTSLTSALAAGGREHFGWGVDRYMKADAFDAINQNTLLTGQWQKGKDPKFPPYPRPAQKAVEAEKSKPKTTLASLRAKFNNSRR